MIATLIILWQKNRNNKAIIELHAAIDNIKLLEKSLKEEEEHEGESECEAVTEEETPAGLQPVDPNPKVEELRKELMKKLMALAEKSGNERNVPEIIKETEAYDKLQELIAGREEFKEKNALWEELEAAVINASPKFKEHLQLLVGGTLSSYDLHTALLIKCGVAPMQMSVLFNRAKGTIVSRRESMSKRIFGKKLGTQTIDSIIRQL